HVSKKMSNSGTIRFFDWNSFLGTFLVTILCGVVVFWSIYTPEFFFEDDEPLLVILPFLFPAMILFAWYRMTISVDFSGMIAFRKLWGKKEYEWSDIVNIQLIEDPTRFLFGLIKIRNRYLSFEMQESGKRKKHKYLARKQNIIDLITMIEVARPDLLPSRQKEIDANQSAHTTPASAPR
ncbi:hypothetical protein, partial [Pelagicoccus sp. SDUM812003]|uniref:hypothetical protein n=1 Tax=Pelagicoccus sp. SDUM812003 TaxID=3041267 RepID=UPI00280FA1A7